MVKAIMSGEDTPGQTKVLYRSAVKGWHEDSIYSMTIKHQPSINSLDVTVEKDGGELWSQQWDKTFDQKRILGKVGVFAESQYVRFYDSTIQPFCIV